MKKALAVLLVFAALFSFVSCKNAGKKTLSEMLTAHKWHYNNSSQNIKDHLKVDATTDFEFEYDYMLEFKNDGTWSLEMNNRLFTNGSWEKANHTIPGTWELDGDTLTVEMKDGEESAFNDKYVVEFADDFNDDNIEKKIIDRYNAADSSASNSLNYNAGTKHKWYVSDKYFYFVNFLFNTV